MPATTFQFKKRDLAAAVQVLLDGCLFATPQNNDGVCIVKPGVGEASKADDVGYWSRINIGKWPAVKASTSAGALAADAAPPTLSNFDCYTGYTWGCSLKDVAAGDAYTGPPKFKKRDLATAAQALLDGCLFATPQNNDGVCIVQSPGGGANANDVGYWSRINVKKWSAAFPAPKTSTSSTVGTTSGGASTSVVPRSRLPSQAR
ncbi:hypothetical protein EMMF5_002750 [Cystobasidiomycetes sp. EMM_F5]